MHGPRPDPPTFVAALGALALGGLLLAHERGALDLTLGTFAPVAFVAVGATLLALALTPRRRRVRAVAQTTALLPLAAPAPEPVAAPPAARPRARTRPPLRRDPDGGVLGGVCAGIARTIGADVALVRVIAVAAAVSGGIGVFAYIAAWIFLPADRRDGIAPAPALTGQRATAAAGAAFVVIAGLLAVRGVGLWFSDAVAWPLVLAAAGLALLWREAGLGRTVQRPAPTSPGERAALVSRTGFGVALVIGAGVSFLGATGALSAARDVALAALVAGLALGLIFAPFLARQARALTAERTARIRSQERAEVAAHLHDSVLQTLALIQRRSDDPGTVDQLARRQERELRAWLHRDESRDRAETLAAALHAAAEEVEADHGARIEVVAVGERALDADAAAVVAATREAMVNAAKFAPGAPVDVYAEGGPDRIEVFVRDRGPGFDPAAVPPDRRGLRDSIVGRLERHGGRVQVNSAPGEGTEIELVLERRA